MSGPRLARRRSLAWGLAALAGLTGLTALAGCRSETPAPRRVQPGELAQAAEQKPGQTTRDSASAARKRECVERALAGAPALAHGLFRSACAEWVERELPGVAVAIVEPGRAPITLELGQRCFGEAPPVTADTTFRWGSISKTVTAAMALGLVAEGSLEARDRVSTHVPGFVAPTNLADPTLAALLRHRSGLAEVDPLVLVELDGAWLRALARSGAGPAGQYNYSNAGYCVIGAMLESVTKQPYAALVDARISTALGLGHVTVRAGAAHEPACGHLDYDPERHPIPVAEDLDFMPGDPRWMNAAGGVLGTATELARFGLALGGDALPGTAVMLEPGDLLGAPDSVRALRPDERYGDGLRSWTLADGTRAYGHSGNNVAFAAELMFVPGRRAVALLTNCGTGLAATTLAAQAVLARP